MTEPTESLKCTEIHFGEMPTHQILALMADGSPAAAKILAELMDFGVMGMLTIRALHDRGIRGERIILAWVEAGSSVGAIQKHLATEDHGGR